MFVGAVMAVAGLAGSAHAGTAQGTATSTQVWGKRFLGGGGANGRAAAFSPDGSKLFVAGRVTPGGPGTQLDAFVVAYDADGFQLWSRSFTGPVAGDDYVNALTVSPDGSKVFVTGVSSSTTASDQSGYDYITIAYDASTGNRLWLKRYDPGAAKYDEAKAIGISPDGSTVFVTGDSTNRNGNTDIATLAYDATTGATRWVKRYDGPGHGDDVGNALAISPDGTKIFVAGDATNTSGNTDYAAVAYDSSTGTQLWASLFNGPAGGDDKAYAIGVSPDGTTVYLGGALFNYDPDNFPQGNYDYGTVAFTTSNGAFRFELAYLGAQQDNDDEIFALAVGSDGNIYVTGRSTHETSCSCPLSYDYATVSYSPTGTRRWVTTYGQPSSLADDSEAFAVAVTPDNTKVIVTGESKNAAGNYDYFTQAYTPLHGTLIWQHRADGPGHGTDKADALAVSADSSRVAVTGLSTNAGGGQDVLTFDYTTG